MKKILLIIFCLMFGINAFANTIEPTKEQIKEYYETVQKYNENLEKLLYYVLDDIKLNQGESINITADISDDNKLSNFKITNQKMSDNKAQDILKRLQTIISIKKPYSSIYYPDKKMNMLTINIKKDYGTTEIFVGLNNKEFDNSAKETNLAPYMRNLERRIKSNWTPPKKDSSKKVIVYFTIGKDGSLLSEKITQSSGDSLVDKVAMKAIEKTFPFKSLPKEFKGDFIPIEFTFDYNVLNQTILPYTDNIIDDKNMKNILKNKHVENK